MAKSYLSGEELDALAPATDAQIETLASSLYTDIAENDIDQREYHLPNVVVPMLQIMKRLEIAEKALSQLVYNDAGTWRIGIKGDFDVTEEVGAAMSAMGL